MSAVARQMAVFDGATGHIVQLNDLKVRRDDVLIAWAGQRVRSCLSYSECTLSQQCDV